VPYEGPDATGLGKPLKLINAPLRSDLPIYLAAMGPRNIALAAEVADGWLAGFASPYRFDLFAPSLEQGCSLRSDGDVERAEFDVAAIVPTVTGDDIDRCRADVKGMVALYLGGMGARGQNFYYELVCRYGYEPAAEQVRGAFLAGDREGAVRAVPDTLVDEIALVGNHRRIAASLDAWQAAGVTTLIVNAGRVDDLALVASVAATRT
jgi:alkanesulfonate monooxygenase SsuD/methylene tetrahydromethanopterin reductase-like flavin-dependent oxidoreductase (luciferase family)